MDRWKISKKIKAHLRQHNINQAEFARRSGVAQETISQYVRLGCSRRTATYIAVENFLANGSKEKTPIRLSRPNAGSPVVRAVKAVLELDLPESERLALAHLIVNEGLPHAKNANVTV